MAISNCWFSPTLEIPMEFPTWFVLAKLSANLATTHSQIVIRKLKKSC
ncbi:MAG: hypothetical protein ACJAVA_001113 [Flavobacteriaceae bacterium]|jgi:hypothetical protein